LEWSGVVWRLCWIPGVFGVLGAMEPRTALRRSVFWTQFSYVAVVPALLATPSVALGDLASSAWVATRPTRSDDVLEDHGGSMLCPRAGHSAPSWGYPGRLRLFQHADHPRPVESNKLRLDIFIGPKITTTFSPRSSRCSQSGVPIADGPLWEAFHNDARMPRDASVGLSGKHAWDAYVTFVQARGAKARMTAAPRRLKHQIKSRLIHDRRNTANPIKL